MLKVSKILNKNKMLGEIQNAKEGQGITDQKVLSGSSGQSDSGRNADTTKILSGDRSVHSAMAKEPHARGWTVIEIDAHFKHKGYTHAIEVPKGMIAYQEDNGGLPTIIASPLEITTGPTDWVFDPVDERSFPSNWANHSIRRML